MIEPELDRAIKSIRGLAPKHCDVCGQKYSESDFKTVKSQSQQTVIHLTCQNCGNSYMLNIMNPVSGMYASSRASMNLDITDTNELVRFASSNAITEDEALDAYNTLLEGKSLDSFLKGIN